MISEFQKNFQMIDFNENYKDNEIYDIYQTNLTFEIMPEKLLAKISQNKQIIIFFDEELIAKYMNFFFLIKIAFANSPNV